ENGGVLAVDGEYADAMFAGFAHDDFAGHDKNFLGSHRDIFTCANGGEGGAKSGCSDNGNQDDISAAHGSELDKTIGARRDINRSTQFAAQLLRPGRIDNGNGFGLMFAGLLEEKINVVSGAQADQANAVRQILGDLDGAGADGASAA